MVRGARAAVVVPAGRRGGLHRRRDTAAKRGCGDFIGDLQRSLPGQRVSAEGPGRLPRRGVDECAARAVRPGLALGARLQSSPLQRSAADGRVLLLGDAAHAMVPTLGQGATQAIEDGVLAGAVLRAGGDVAAVAALRDPRVEFVRRFSLEASDTMLPGSDPVAGRARRRGPSSSRSSGAPIPICRGQAHSAESLPPGPVHEAALDDQEHQVEAVAEDAGGEDRGVHRPASRTASAH